MKFTLCIILSLQTFWLAIPGQHTSIYSGPKDHNKQSDNRKNFKRLVVELQALKILLEQNDNSGKRLTIVSKVDEPELQQLVDQSLSSTIFLDSMVSLNVPQPSLEYFECMDRKADHIAQFRTYPNEQASNIKWFRAMSEDLLLKVDHAENSPLAPFNDISVEVTTFINGRKSGVFEVWYVCDDYKDVSPGHRFKKLSDTMTGKTSEMIPAGVYQLYTVAMNRNRTRGDMGELRLGKGMKNVEIDLPARD